MITRNDYEQLKGFAGIDGAMLGVLWIVSFACFIGEFYNAIFGFASLAIGVGSLVFVVMRLRRFRDVVRDGEMSFRRGYAYCIYVFFYAALLMAAAQFVYFRFIDHGFMLEQYSKVMSQPEFKTMLQVYGVRADEMQLAMDNLAALKPIEIALQFLTTNIILGVIISLPIAVMMKRAPRFKP